MTYLDYLPDTPYADLPPAAQAEISATEYAQLQVLSNGLAEPAALPSALGLALAAKVPVVPSPSLALGKTSGVHAGWRLAALLSMAGFLGLALWSAYAKTEPLPVPLQPEPQTIERVVIQRDTVEQVVRDTVTLFQTKVEIREVRDTVYLKRNYPIAEVEPVDIDEIKGASKSLSTGLNWGELTVRGDGGFSERD
ncbi:MAG: hypothetical protein AB8F78_18395 [Saprospiraceae bacterium]